MQRGIDHLVLAVADLAAARDRFERLGFSTTPLGRHPWGTANHLVQFPHNFIELLGVVEREEIVPMSAGHFSFSAHNDRFLAKREGLSMLVLSTDDAHADAEQWRSRGLHVYEPVHWSRKATLPDGAESTVAFTLTFVVDPLMPEIAFFSCQQHNPEAFWKPQYQAHENSAAGIAEVTLVAGQPKRHAAFLTALLDGARVDEEGEGLRFTTARGAIRVESPTRFAARYPGARLSGDGSGALFMAATVVVADLERAARCLDRNGIPYSSSATALHVGHDNCFGMVLELAQRSA